MSDAIVTRSAFTGEIRVVDAGRGVVWLREGRDYFMSTPGVWLIIVLVFLVFTIGLSFIPMVGALNAILVPLLAGGIMYGCRAVARGDRLEFRHLLEGFEHNTPNLLLLGLVNLAMSVAAVAIIFMVVVGVLGTAVLAAVVDESWSGPTAMAGLLLVVVLAAALSVPLTMAMWFAPALIAFHNLSPLEATKLSFLACAHNVVAFLVYGLILVPLTLCALLPLGLGLLVLAPVVWASIYVSYVDVFER